VRSEPALRRAPLPRSEWAFPAPPSPWSAGLAHDVSFLLSKIGSRSNKLFAEALEPLGLRPNHVAVLSYLRCREGASQRELVDGLWIDASSMVTLLDEFEKRGLAERRPNPSDKRAYAVYLTAKGGRLLSRALELSEQVAWRLLAPLSADERQLMHGLLLRIVGLGGAEEEAVHEVSEAGISGS
jgi:MarR family transcriptional regulator, lower aerobic nicotinate degradation pathway regulator